MSINLWLAFVAATVVLLVIPGPTILTVISYSLSHGKRAWLPLVAGVALGDSTALLLSLLGLGALLKASAFWFTVVKWIGGLYLIYLGVSMLRAAAKGSSPLQESSAATVVSRWRLFANTWLVTALNPKGMIFFLAFLPQFIDPARAVAPQLWIVSITFVVLASLNAALYASFASAARRALSTPRAVQRFNIAGGVLLTGAGVWALFARRLAR